jgi:hypothetical protein
MNADGMPTFKSVTESPSAAIIPTAYNINEIQYTGIGIQHQVESFIKEIYVW